MVYAFVAALAMGVVSTFGDFVWEALGLQHRMWYGLVHGAVICLSIGAVIGIRERRIVPAIAAGPLIGLLAAGGFYLLAPWLRYAAMFPMWMLFWLCFALLQGWLQRATPRGLRTVALRGLAAAVLSGAAFYMISGIWTERSPAGPNYLRHFLAWSFAFLPGFLSLFAGRRPGADGLPG